MIHSDNMLGNGALSLGNLDFNTALEATGRPEPDRSFLNTAIAAADINNDVPLQQEPVVNPMQRLTDVCLYNEDEGAAERVTGDVLVSETARGDVFGQNMLIGVELADMMTGGDVYETAERLISGLPREQQQAWRDKLNHCHTKADGQALVGELFRKDVEEEYRKNVHEHETKAAAVSVVLSKMGGYVAGDAMAENGNELTAGGLSEGELAKLVGVVDSKKLADARAVREWMQTYVRPLDSYDDAERILRTVNGLEDELLELIGADESRAEMAYQAMMHWAEQVKKSGKVGVTDEFVVAVGKKLSNWSNPRVQAAFAAVPGVGAAGSINTQGLEAAGERIQERAREARRTQTARAILRRAINASMETDDAEFWVGSLRNAASMLGESFVYLLPRYGAVAGTVDSNVGSLTEGYEGMMLDGLESNAAAGQTLIEAGVNTAAELLPWSRIGGKGLSGFLRAVTSKINPGGMTKKLFSPGNISRWLTRHTQKSATRAFVAETVSSVIDEGVIEPIVSGLLTYGAERTFDLMGLAHDKSKTFAECFEELSETWTDAKQLAGLAMFSAGLSGASLPAIRANVRWFSENRTMWEAQGLLPEQVDEVMASDDPLATGAKMVNDGWANDAAGMRERMLKNNEEIKNRGEVLFLTGQGALDTALSNEALAPAYAGVWRAYAEQGVLPHVEATGDGMVHITKKDRFGKGNDVDLVLSAEDADAYLIHEFEEVEKRWLKERQRTEGASAERPNLRGFLMQNVSEVTGGAMLREAAEKKAVRVEDVTRYLPEELGALVKKQGGINRVLAERISEWARGMIDGLMADGASEAEARRSRDYAEGAVMSLGDMEGFARSFAERGEIGQMTGDVQTSLFRYRGGMERVIDGKKILGSTLFGVPGRATAFNAVEDVAESMLDEAVQARVLVLSGDGQMSYAEAEGKAWSEMAGQVARAREAVLKADPKLVIPVPDGAKPMSVIEAFSAMAMSKFILSSATPGWMKPMVEAMKANLTAAAAVDAMGRAWAAAAESDPDALGSLADVLDKVGVRVADALSETRIEQADVVAWTVASGIVMSHVNGPDGAGGLPVSKVVADADEEEQAILQHESPLAEETVEEAKQESARAAEQAERLMEMQAAQGANAPAEMRGVFDGDNCAYNAAGGYWFGMIQKSKLVKSTEQVKVGTKGKHGVIAGRELTGNFQASAAPLYVWMRSNGELWLISGRHRYELMMRDNGVESHPCYVFREDAEHDEKWARMMDYENNMRDDQADELTAGTYVRETGLSDAELEVRGLMRNESRSKRGALIGRHAREELWTRFSNGKIKAKDAEVICNLTRYIKDQSRVDEIQRRCCMLLDNGKSWDYIGGMVQLMVQAELEQGQQGWFNFGADFEAALERAATWIEKALKAVNENIELAKRGRDMSGKKADKAARLGIVTSAGEDVQQTLQDLQVLKGKLELIGSYPELRQQAEMWDGESEVDPVGWMLQQQALENERMAEEKELEAEEYLKQQQAEATGTLFSMSMSAEMKAIKEAAEKDGTFMKAPNGKQSNLNEKQWLQVRTAAFKRWFGDWERAAELTISSGRMSYNDAEKKLTQDEVRIRNEETGIVVPINRDQITKMTSQKAMRKSLNNGFTAFQHNAVVANVKGVFKNAIKVGDYKDKKDDVNIESIKRFASPVVIDGEKALVFLTVKCSFQRRKKRGEKATKEVISRLYSVELDEIVKLDGHMKRLEHLQQNASASSSEEIIAKFNAKVKEYFDNVSKIVDFNGEPLVVYHGSPTAGIREFRNHRALYGDGVFFTESPEEALEYTGLDRDDFDYWDDMDEAAVEAGLLYEAFLNIRDDERFYHGGGGTYHARAIAPNEIKSATDNRGTFDGSSPDITFSVVGEKAANWDKIKHLAFRGRDDGKLRVEIDDSQAKVKTESLMGKAEKAYERLISGWDKLPEDERFAVLDYADLMQKYKAARSAWRRGGDDTARPRMDAAEKEMNAARFDAFTAINAWFAAQGIDDVINKLDEPTMMQLAESFLHRRVDSVVRRDLARLYQGDVVKLEDVLDFPELYEAYPRLRSVAVSAIPLEGGMQGQANRWNNSIDLDTSILSDTDTMRSVLLHEVQHIIQGIEGFAKGGNTVNVRDKVESILENTGYRMDALARDLQWLSGVEIARDYLIEARKLRRRKNAWKHSGLMYMLRSWGESAEETREKIIQDIARRYNAFREQDNMETEYRNMPEAKLPRVYFSDINSIEEGLKSLENAPSRKMANRGEAAKKNRKLEELVRRSEVTRKVLEQFKYEPYELYVRLAGEIESRNVQLRRDWTAEQRAARPFNETLEYPGEALVSFSAVGENAENWDKIKHLAFRGRDDGKMRVELDASQARINMPEKWYGDANPHRLYESLKTFVAAAKAGRLPEKDAETLMRFADTGEGYWAACIVLDKYIRKEGDWWSSVHFLGEDYVRLFAKAFRDGRVSGETRDAIMHMPLANSQELGDVLDFPELYEAYPELRQLKVSYQPVEKQFGGHFAGNHIAVSDRYFRNPEALRTILLHEVQHWIQQKEGFARGTNPQEAGSWKGYMMEAGEIEARNVQLRQDWTAAERAARPFNETLEYPGAALVSYSMQRVTQRSMELLESRSEEEVAQQIMDDMRKACERLSLLMADDGTDVRRGNGLRVYAEMQALLSAVRQALPEKYLKQGNLEMLLRWASVYAKMATDGEVPVRGLIKGDVFDSFVAVLEKQNKQEQLHGMTAEESREALMELAGEKLEVAFMKVARDCVRRIDQFLKDRALERIEWVYQHAYPTREEGRAWGRGKMDSENYRVVNAAWQLVQGSLNKRKEAEEEMRLVRRQMVKVREQLKGKEIEEGEGKRWLKKLNEQLAQLELAAMQAAAEQQAALIKSISEELESLDTDAADFSDKEAAANERMALQQTFGNWYYKDALEARRAARVFEDMVLRGKKQWEEKLKVEREEIAYWREQILSGFEVGREKATNRRMKQRNAVRTRLDKQLVGMGKGLMNFGQLMLALRPLLGRRFCDMKREQISQMHTNTMAFNTELKNWMFRTLRDITGLQTETEQELWLADQNQARDTGIVITERATVKAALTYAEALRWLGMSVAEREKERARMIAEAAAAKRKPSNVPTEEMMEELGQLVSEYERDDHGVDPQNKKFVVQAVEEWQTELHTTKDAVLFGILTFEQPDYERLMEPNGITPEILDQMRRYVGPKMLRWGYAMREKLSEHGVNVARVFEEYTGIPFDSRENYFKGVFDQGALKEQTLEQAVAAASGASGTGSKYGSLIPRRYHMSKINWDTSALGVFVTSMQQQNVYVQTSRMVRNWRALLTDKEFAKRVEAEIGTAAKQQIIGWLELIEGAVVADVKMAELSNRMLRRLMGGYAKASLGGNVRTLIKQVSAMLNGYAGGYVPDKWMLNNELCQEMTYRKIGFGEYMMALARVLSSRGSVSRGETKQQAFIYARKAVEGDGLLRVAYLAANQKLPGQADGWLGQKEVPKGVLAWLGQKANKVVEKAMDAISVVDAEMCTASAMAIADVAYRQAVAADVQNVVPDDVKRAEALRLAGMALDVAGQPQLRTQKSYWAASGALKGMGDFLFMFRSDTLSKAGLWIAQATSGEGKAAVGGWLAFGIMNSLVLAMLEGLRGNLGDEDDEWYQYAAAFGMNVLTNDATALPVVGDTLAKIRAGIMGEPVFQNGLSDLVPFGEVFEKVKREVKNIRKGASRDRHWNATADLLRAIGSGCAVCQDSTIGPLANLSSLAMAAAVFANSTKFVQGLIKLGEEVTE